VCVCRPGGLASVKSRSGRRAVPWRGAARRPKILTKLGRCRLCLWLCPSLNSVRRLLRQTIIAYKKKVAVAVVNAVSSIPNGSTVKINTYLVRFECVSSTEVQTYKFSSITRVYLFLRKHRKNGHLFFFFLPLRTFECMEHAVEEGGGVGERRKKFSTRLDPVALMLSIAFPTKREGAFGCQCHHPRPEASVQID
jgi:hypothetical protein